jgi:hypothetical protein
MTSPPGTTSPAVAQKLSTNAINAAFTPEPFVSLDEESAGLEELADLDQGSIQDIPIQSYAVTQAWAAKYPNTLESFTRALAQGSRSPTLTVRRWSSPSRSTCRFRPRPPRSSPCLASRPGWTRYASSGW